MAAGSVDECPLEGYNLTSEVQTYIVSTQLKNDDNPLLDFSADNAKHDHQERILNTFAAVDGTTGDNQNQIVISCSASRVCTNAGFTSSENSSDFYSGVDSKPYGAESVTFESNFDLFESGDSTFLTMDTYRKVPIDLDEAKRLGELKSLISKRSDSSQILTSFQHDNNQLLPITQNCGIKQNWSTERTTDKNINAYNKGVPDVRVLTSVGGAIVIDCAEGPDSRQEDELLPWSMHEDAEREMMLNSLPRSISVDQRVDDDYDFEVEAHCHSGIRRQKMSDKLAQKQLLAVLGLCVLFMVGETVGGVLANSLALFTDVLHLASDLISYFISLIALCLAKKSATKRMTFGYYRAEVLGALFSVFIIWLVSGILCYIAVERIIQEHYKDVKPNEMLITASLGVVFNLIMGIVLQLERCCGTAARHTKFGHGHSHSHGNSHSRSRLKFPSLSRGNSHQQIIGYEALDSNSLNTGTIDEAVLREDIPMHEHKNINVRAAFIHTVGDIIQSIGVLVAALIIKFMPDEKYRLADPICTFLFSILVLLTTINVLKDTICIIMEGAPQGVDLENLKSQLLSLDSVVAVHSLNIWALTMDHNAISVHIAIDSSRHNDEVLKDATALLKQHNFFHLTIQVEPYKHVMTSCIDCQLPIK